MVMKGVGVTVSLAICPNEGAPTWLSYEGLEQLR